MNETLLSLLAATSLLGCLYLVLRLRAATRSHAAMKGEETGDRTLLETRSTATEILERMNEGVLLVDRSLKPRFANATARRLLGFQDTELPFRLPSVEVGDGISATPARSTSTSSASGLSSSPNPTTPTTS